jgi:hypothetical protein
MGKEIVTVASRMALLHVRNIVLNTETITGI